MDNLFAADQGEVAFVVAIAFARWIEFFEVDIGVIGAMQGGSPSDRGVVTSEDAGDARDREADHVVFSTPQADLVKAAREAHLEVRIVAKQGATVLCVAPSDHPCATSASCTFGGEQFGGIRRGSVKGRRRRGGVCEHARGRGFFEGGGWEDRGEIVGEVFGAEGKAEMRRDQALEGFGALAEGVTDRTKGQKQPPCEAELESEDAQHQEAIVGLPRGGFGLEDLVREGQAFGAADLFDVFVDAFAVGAQSSVGSGRDP